MAASTTQPPLAKVAGGLQKATQGPAGAQWFSVILHTNQLQVRSMVGVHTGGNQSLLSPSSPSPPSFLSKINKNISEGEDILKQ